MSSLRKRIHTQERPKKDKIFQTFEIISRKPADKSEEIKVAILLCLENKKWPSTFSREGYRLY